MSATSVQLTLLVERTDELLEAINIPKLALDDRVIAATAQAVIATDKAALTALDRTATGQNLTAVVQGLADTVIARDATLAAKLTTDRLYPGSFATDPLLRPDGTARQVGDEMFNSTAGLKKRWSGVVWQASDINTANLAAATGATLLGFHPTGVALAARTVADRLLDRASVMDYMTPAERADARSMNPVLDHTASITSAINSGKALFWPYATYVVDEMIIPSGANWLGDKCVIRDKSNSALAAQVRIAPGPVIRVNISGFRFTGSATNPNKRCWFFDAQVNGVGGLDGGCWWSNFSDIYVSGYEKAGLYLRGGPSTGATAYLLPHQFLTFTNFQVFGGAGEDAVVFEGQVGQVNFFTIQFEGKSGLTRAMNIKRHIRADTTIDDCAPYSLTFHTPTFQWGSEVLIERAKKIVFHNPYMENMKSGFSFVTSWEFCAIYDPDFRNVFKGDTTGFLIKTGSASAGTGQLYVSNPEARGTVELGIVGSSNGGIIIDGFSNVTSTGCTRQLASETGIANLGDVTTVILTAVATINTITAGASVGKSIFIKSHTSPVTYGTADNIKLPAGMTSATFGVDQTAQFVRYDLTGTWRLVNGGYLTAANGALVIPGIAAAARFTTTIAVPGAKLGAYCQAAFSLNLSGMKLFAEVSAVDTVTISIENGTASTVPTQTGVMRVRVVNP